MPELMFYLNFFWMMFKNLKKLNYTMYDIEQ